MSRETPPGGAEQQILAAPGWTLVYGSLPVRIAITG